MDLLAESLKKQGLSGWAKLYQDPSASIKTPLLAMMPPDLINSMFQEISNSSPEDQSKWLAGFLGEAIAENQNPEALEESATEFYSDLSESGVGLDWLPQREGFIVACLFNTLASMVHKKSIYQLVAEAIGGNDQSFLKAIQIDKTTLEEIPYFVERNRIAADKGQFKFQRQIHEYRNRPCFQTRLQYLKLWLVFSTLDFMNLLGEFEADLQRFAELCQKLRVYGPHPDADAVDVEAFMGRLNDYKKTARLPHARPEQRILVKDVSSPNSHT